MILQESAVNTALNQEGWPRSRLHPHSSTLKARPHPGQFGDQRPHSFYFLGVSMHIGALWQSGVRSPGPGRDSPSVVSWIWMTLFGGTHRTVLAVSFSRSHHTLHGLLAQVVRKGTVGQGRGEVLPNTGACRLTTGTG